MIRVEATPPPEPGFLGEGHLAVDVLRPHAAGRSDPFVLLMDDRLTLEHRRQLGGAHPHAGLETVTLVLEGSVTDRDEGALSAGDAAWMTAGRGVVHSEHVEAEGDVRILQLWLGLPARARLAPPSLQVLRAAEQPTRSEAGAFLRLYSGEAGGLKSRTTNLVPVTLAEIVLEPGVDFALQLPASQSGFLYVIAGELSAGTSRKRAREGDLAWLDAAASGRAPSELTLSAGPAGARAVLYAGEPHQEALVQHGPFVADSERTIASFHDAYRRGRFPGLSQLKRAALAQTRERSA